MNFSVFVCDTDDEFTRAATYMTKNYTVCIVQVLFIVSSIY